MIFRILKFYPIMSNTEKWITARSVCFCYFYLPFSLHMLSVQRVTFRREGRMLASTEDKTKVEKKEL